MLGNMISFPIYSLIKQTYSEPISYIFEKNTYQIEISLGCRNYDGKRETKSRKSDLNY